MATTTTTFEQQSQLLAKLKSAASRAEFEQVQKEAKDLKISLPTSSVNAARVTMTKALNAKYEKELAKITTQEQLDDIKSRIAADEAKPNIGFVERAQTVVAKTTATAAAAEKAAAEKAAAADKIAADRAAAAEKVAAEKAAAEKATADRAAAAETQRLARIQAEEQKAAEAARATAEAETARLAKIEAQNVKNLSEDPRYQSAVKQVTESGQPLTQAAILSQYESQQAAAAQAQAQEKQQRQQAEQQQREQAAAAAKAAAAETQQKALQATYDYAAKLAPPTTVTNRFTPDGTELQGRPDDPTTPENEAGWYAPTATGGLQQIGADGRPTGPVVPNFDEFKKITDQAQTNIATYQKQQAADQQAAQAAAQQTTRLSQQYQKQISDAVNDGTISTASLAEIQRQATAAGATIDPSSIARAQEKIQGNLNSHWTDEIGRATTTEQLDQILTQAQAAGASLNSGQIDQARSVTQQRQQKAQSAAAQQVQQAADTEKYITDLPKPGSEKFNVMAGNRFSFTAPDGSVINAVPANQATGEPGGYYRSRDGGQTYQDIAGTGPVLPAEEYERQFQSVYQTNVDFQNQQAADARLSAAELRTRTAEQQQLADQYNQQVLTATTQDQLDSIIGSARGAGVNLDTGYVDRAKQLVNYQETQAALAAQTAAENQTLTQTFEKNLPPPGSAKFNEMATNFFNFTAPDGREYYAVPGGAGTGAARYLVSSDSGQTFSEVGATGPGLARNQVTAGIQANNAAINAQAQQQRADQIRQSAEDRAGLGLDDFFKVMAVMAIGSAVMGAISGAGAAGQAALAGSTAGETAAAAAGMAESGLTASEIAAALEAEGIGSAAAQAAAETATGLASGTLDAATIVAESGLSPEAFTAAAESANPLSAINETITTVAGSGSAAPLYELSAAETAELMKNIDPNMISNLAPGTAGTAGGTAGSIFSGQSINPITNALVNSGITNPVALGALSGALTSAGMGLVTGQPITGKSLLTGALGGGVAGGIGDIMPDFGGGALGGAIGGAATNLGATAVVSLVTGQPITAGSLAGAALIGGVIGGAVGAYTDGAGNTTYQYEDGSSMTVSRTGTPVAVTDSTGASVPVGAVDRLTGEPKPMAPVEDRVGTPVDPNQRPVSYDPTTGAPVVEGPVDITSYGQGDTPGQVSTGTDGEQYLTLDSGKVVKLSEYQAAIDSGQPISVDGQIDTQYRVDMGSPPRYSGMPDAGGPPEGYEVAKPEDVHGPDDSGSAQNPYKPGTYYDPATNTWFTPAVPPAPAVPIDTTGIDAGPVIPVDAVPTTPTAPTTPVYSPPDYPPLDVTPGPLPDWYTNPQPPVDTIPPSVPPTAPTDPTAPAGPAPGDIITQPVDRDPNPNAVITPGTGTNPVANVDITGGTGTTPGTGGPGTGGPGTVPGIGTPGTGGPGTGPGPVAPPPPDVTPLPEVVTPPPEPPLEPLPPGEPAPPPVPPGPDITPPDVTPPVVEPPYVPPTYPPIYVPPIEPPVTPPKKVYDPLPPTNFGEFGTLVNPGLNPGYITNVPRSYAPSGVRSQFYYGQRPYQPGPTFNRELYNQTPAAPVAPWGLQQMYNPQTQTIENLLRGMRAAAATPPYNVPGAPRI